MDRLERIRSDREARSPARRILAPILALLLLTAACGGDEPRRRVSRPQQPGTIEIGGESARDHGMVTVTAEQPVSVTAGEFYFEPTLLAGSPGLEVQVQVLAAAGSSHSFTLPEQQVDTEVEGTAPAAVTVRFPATGIVRFYCRYHRDRGMVGGLVAA